MTTATKFFPAQQPAMPTRLNVIDRGVHISIVAGVLLVVQEPPPTPCTAISQCPDWQKKLIVDVKPQISPPSGPVVHVGVPGPLDELKEAGKLPVRKPESVTVRLAGIAAEQQLV